MRFLLRFVKLCAAFVKTPFVFRLAWLCSRYGMPLPSSLAAVHTWSSVRSSFAFSSRKPHYRMSFVNDNQNGNTLVVSSGTFCIWIGYGSVMHYRWPMYCVFTKSSIARKSKNWLWNWHGYFSRVQAYSSTWTAGGPSRLVLLLARS